MRFAPTNGLAADVDDAVAADAAVAADVAVVADVAIHPRGCHNSHRFSADALAILAADVSVPVARPTVRSSNVRRTMNCSIRTDSIRYTNSTARFAGCTARHSNRRCPIDTDSIAHSTAPVPLASNSVARRPAGYTNRHCACPMEQTVGWAYMVCT